jgi:uncharacterized membrane protein
MLRAQRVPMIRVAGWLFLLLLCLAVAAYAVAFLVLGEQMYAPNFAASFLARSTSLKLHVAGGGLALLIGPFLIVGPRARRARHRILGRLYAGAVLVGGLGGLSLARFSYGGWVTHLGFAALGLAWIGATSAAWLQIRQGDVAGHRAWMTRSFLLTLAAVTLRVYLPLASLLGLPFDTSYALVSWMCWIPNLLLAEVIVRRSGWSRSPSLGMAFTA